MVGAPGHSVSHVAGTSPRRRASPRDCVWGLRGSVPRSRRVSACTSLLICVSSAWASYDSVVKKAWKGDWEGGNGDSFWCINYFNIWCDEVRWSQRRRVEVSRADHCCLSNY